MFAKGSLYGSFHLICNSRQHNFMVVFPPHDTFELSVKCWFGCDVCSLFKRILLQTSGHPSNIKTKTTVTCIRLSVSQRGRISNFHEFSSYKLFISKHSLAQTISYFTGFCGNEQDLLSRSALARNRRSSDINVQLTRKVPHMEFGPPCTARDMKLATAQLLLSYEQSHIVVVITRLVLG